MVFIRLGQSAAGNIFKLFETFGGQASSNVVKQKSSHFEANKTIIDGKGKDMRYALLVLLLTGVCLAATAEQAAPPEATTTPTVKQKADSASEPGHESRVPDDEAMYKLAHESIGIAGQDISKHRGDMSSEEVEALQDAMRSPVSIIGVFIPIVAIVMSIGLVMFIVWLDFRRKRLLHEERLKAIELGREIPPYVEPKKDPLKTGIILTCFGIGIGIAIGITSEEMQTAALGAVLLIPGIGYIIYHFITKNRRQE